MKAAYSFFELGPKLGAGCFGAVHECIHPVQGKIAVKVIEKDDEETDNEWHERKMGLLAEGQHLKKAENDRVVRVYDVTHDAEEDKVYLSLELCKCSLGRYYENGPLDIASLRTYLNDTTAGLCCVHNRNILHRDIKPMNILVGNDGRAKLGDFGLVTDRLIFGYGSMAGYKDHIAYEVWQDGLTSKKSDIWALGMTAYRLLLGKAYYDSLPLPRDEVQEGGYAQKLRWLAHIPKSWRSFIRKCLADDPQKRFPTAESVQTAMSVLPIEPNWQCKHLGNSIIWTRVKSGRRIEVTHQIHSPRKHEWNAISYPVDKEGRKRKLAESNGIISRANAIKDLEAFLGRT